MIKAEDFQDFDAMLDDIDECLSNGYEIPDDDERLYYFSDGVEEATKAICVSLNCEKTEDRYGYYNAYNEWIEKDFYYQVSFCIYYNNGAIGEVHYAKDYCTARREIYDMLEKA